MPDQDIKQILSRLGKADTSLFILPKSTTGLKEACDMAERIYKDRIDVFWNVPCRASAKDDATFLGLVLSGLKRRGGRKGWLDAIQIINFLEEQNAD